MLIVQIHPMISLYKCFGEQFKYHGHVINFMQNIEDYIEVLPLHPTKLQNIIIFTKKLIMLNLSSLPEATIYELLLSG